MAEEKVKKVLLGKATKNILYNSPYKEYAETLLRDGMRPTDVWRELANQGFDVAPNVVHNFAKILKELDEAKEEDSMSGYGILPPADTKAMVDSVPENERIRNDGEVLDLIIQRFASQLRAGQVAISPAVALKAIDMKKNMMGVKYKGQTVWSLMESQMQFDQLTKIINEVVTHEQFETIMAKLEHIGIVTTERPSGIAPNLDLDREIEREEGHVDPLREAEREV